jgi:hypothetical protein
MMRLRNRISTGMTACTAGLLLTGAAVLSTAAPASAAVCTHRTGVSHSDVGALGYEHTWTADSVCGNDAGAPVYASSSATTRIGVMNTTSSWFVCWVHGAPHAGGNDIWYYTQGDRVVSHPEFHAWGYVPAVNVHTTHDPGDSRLSQCP